MTTDHEVLQDVLRWAEQRCPCRNEEPDPCPLCGASVSNLEPCKSAENTLPHDLLVKIRVAAHAREAGAQEPVPVAVPVGELKVGLYSTLNGICDCITLHQAGALPLYMAVEMLKRTKEFLRSLAAPVSPPADSGEVGRLRSVIEEFPAHDFATDAEYLREIDQWWAKSAKPALASAPAPQPDGAVKVKARPLDLATMLKHAWIAGNIGTAWEDYDPTELIVYRRLAETLGIPLPTPPAGES